MLEQAPKRKPIVHQHVRPKHRMAIYHLLSGYIDAGYKSKLGELFADLAKAYAISDNIAQKDISTILDQISHEWTDKSSKELGSIIIKNFVGITPEERLLLQAMDNLAESRWIEQSVLILDRIIRLLQID